ncbi:MAG: class I SAM-dependent RNA methyltransferase [Acidobacteria bacterium]|nr:class I SAM-dependent RNA methyltransferase [Acidobacteriota bacterium]
MTTPLAAATPRCPHFGTCGGCQYQDLAYDEQLRLKRSRLEDLLQQSGIAAPPHIALHAAEPYQYRNRIRLRLETVAGKLRLGYNIRATTEFLPITTCPIAAPLLWETAESLLTTASVNRDAAYWLSATAEIEIFTNQDSSRVQLTLFCTPRTKAPPPGQPGHFGSAFAALQSGAPQMIGAAAAAFDPRTGPTGRTLAEAGSPGLNYTVAVPNQPAETYWITRGAFFQVNRFLVETLVRLVCNDASEQPLIGALAWDLYAGVGLFSRVLARSFKRITAVEANPTAATDLRSTLAKLSPDSVAVQSTTLDFLRRAALDRDRPDLIVLDPPRAGAGPEACELLNRIAAPILVYVSCDPATLARDLSTLQHAYKLTTIHLIDLFPQTAHLETITILRCN